MLICAPPTAVGDRRGGDTNPFSLRPSDHAQKNAEHRYGFQTRLWTPKRPHPPLHHVHVPGHMGKRARALWAKGARAPVPTALGRVKPLDLDQKNTPLNRNPLTGGHSTTTAAAAATAEPAAAPAAQTAAVRETRTAASARVAGTAALTG